MSSVCKKDENYKSKWGDSGKTAKMMARQLCTNEGKYDAKINDCGGWSFNATCSNDIPSDWSSPISDEYAKELNHSNRNAFAISDCKKKGFSGIDSGQFRDKGEWAFSLKCINTTPDGWTSFSCSDIGTGRMSSKLSLPSGVDKEAGAKAYAASIVGKTINGKDITRATGRKDIKGSYVDAYYNDDKCNIKTQGWNLGSCSNVGQANMWSKLTIPSGGDWESGAKAYAEKIVGTTVNGRVISKATGRKDFTGAYVDAYYNDDKCDVKWDQPYTGCDSASNMISIQKCNNWIDGDPNSCLKSSKANIGGKAPKTVRWANCAIGSSPGGLAKGDSALLCSPVSKDENEFGCVTAQNCFAVTSFKQAKECESALSNLSGFLTNPLGFLSSGIFITIFIFVAFLFVLYVAVQIKSLFR